MPVLWLTVLVAMLTPVPAVKAAEKTLLVTTFPQRKGSRDFWSSILEFWPPSFGRVLFLAETEQRQKEDWREFEACLNSSSFAPAFAELTKPKAKVSQYHLSKNFWKFYLDEYCESDESIIAMIDDDACLIDHVVESDFLTRNDVSMNDGAAQKIIVHGLPNHMNRYFSDIATVREWVNSLGLHFSGDFMSDFPVFVWRDMFPDLRAWMVHKALKVQMSSDAATARSQFWKAFSIMFSSHWWKSEYALIYNYAFTSRKWRTRYELRFAPKHQSIGLSMHQHTRGCPSKQQIAPLREFMLYYPNALRTHFFEGEGEFRPSCWAQRNLTSPLFDDHWKRGPQQNATMDAVVGSFRKGVIAGSGNTTYWNSLLGQHNRDIQAIADSGLPLSYVEIYPRVIKEWKKCFGNDRMRKKHVLCHHRFYG